jgi:hypothetical protein
LSAFSQEKISMTYYEIEASAANTNDFYTTGIATDTLGNYILDYPGKVG